MRFSHQLQVGDQIAGGEHSDISVEAASDSQDGAMMEDEQSRSVSMQAAASPEMSAQPEGVEWQMTEPAAEGGAGGSE
jgi:hypothetical protein